MDLDLTPLAYKGMQIIIIIIIIIVGQYMPLGTCLPPINSNFSSN